MSEYRLLKETKPIASKDYKCIWCGHVIKRGSRYISEQSVYDGRMQNHHWHQECISACEEVNTGEFSYEFDPYDNERPKGE
jgi:hypothetical protein